MANSRIKMPKNKQDIIEMLKYSDENKRGLFRTYADLMVFAAMFGFANDYYVPFEGFYGDPIRIEVFERAGYEKIFFLLALAKSNKPEYLADNEEAEQYRVDLFEGYANGGLEKLENRLKGIIDPIDFVMLLISQYRTDDSIGI